jgi:hypothetical protein
MPNKNHRKEKHKENSPTPPNFESGMSQIKIKTHSAVPTSSCTQTTDTQQQAAISRSHADCELLAARPHQQRRKTMTAIETDLQVKSE